MRQVAGGGSGHVPSAARRLGVERHMWFVRLDTIACALVVIIMLGILLAQVLVGVPFGALLEAQRLASRGIADEPDLYDVLAATAPSRLRMATHSLARRLDP
jgi:hypothetical protein